MKSKNINSDALLVVIDEWSEAAKKHRELQQKLEAGGDFQRARRQEVMAEIYDICYFEIRSLIRVYETKQQ